MSDDPKGWEKGDVNPTKKGYLLPWKLTCPLKRDYFNRKYIFQPLIFRGHVSFQGSKNRSQILFESPGGWDVLVRINVERGRWWITVLFLWIFSLGWVMLAKTWSTFWFQINQIDKKHIWKLHNTSINKKYTVLGGNGCNWQLCSLKNSVLVLWKVPSLKFSGVFFSLSLSLNIPYRIHGTGIFTYMNGWFLW